MKETGTIVTQMLERPTAGERPTTLLNQIVAVRATIKGDTEQALTAHYRRLSNEKLLSGMSRTYKPVEDGGYVYPAESVQPQVKAEVVLKEIAADLTKLFDVTAQLDWTNQHARSDIIIWPGDEPIVLLRDVPVTYLMFLEKALVNIETVIRRLPVLDPTEQWQHDPATDAYRTNPVGTVRTKKVRRAQVLAEATDRHPAQVESYTEDEPVGTYTTIKYSGALPAARVNKMLARVTTLMEAVKMARENANTTEIVDQKPGRRIFEYLFAADE